MKFLIDLFPILLFFVAYQVYDIYWLQPWRLSPR